jgi:hypothetical protein
MAIPKTEGTKELERRNMHSKIWYLPIYEAKLLGTERAMNSNSHFLFILTTYHELLLNTKYLSYEWEHSQTFV